MNILTLFFTLFLITSSSYILAQKTNEVQKIKIKKELQFVKAAFDETEYKVIAFDKYGNPHQNVVKSFVVFYKDNNNAYENKIMGNTFTETLITFFTKKRKAATKICITTIIAENSEGHLETLPNLCDIVLFPDCKKAKR